MSQERPPLACTLPSNAMVSRIAWLKELKSRSLLDHWRDAGSLHLLFAKDARRDVEDLVAKESACCGFLAFTLSDTARAVHLTVTPPTEAAGFIDELLRQFEPE